MPKTKIYIAIALAAFALSSSVLLAPSDGGAPIGTPASVAAVQAGGAPDTQLTVIGPPPAPFQGGFATDEPPGPDGQIPYKPPYKSDYDSVPSGPIVGSPGIQPTIIGAGPNEAAFTEADVIQYHRIHNAYGIWGYPSSVPPTIEKIEFLTDRQLRQQSPGYNTNRPDDAPVAYVEYRGAFYMNLAPGTAPIPCQFAFEIFDAHTGNRIMYGVDPRTK